MKADSYFLRRLNLLTQQFLHHHLKVPCLGLSHLKLLWGQFSLNFSPKLPGAAFRFCSAGRVLQDMGQ
jgi:hypothetical protein